VAHARNQLIEKRLAIRQLAYLLIGFWQKMLAVPGKLRMKFGEELFSHEMLEAAKALVVEALNEVSNFQWRINDRCALIYQPALCSLCSPCEIDAQAVCGQRYSRVCIQTG
jgi:hypothetical protein